MSNKQNDRKNPLNATTVLVAFLLTQVGCITLALVGGSLFGGLWLDQRFGTKPIITILLLLLSIPLSVIIMLFVVRKSTSKLQTEISSKKLKEEVKHIGTDTDHRNFST